ncbi:sigma-54-dependent Fis family transcriptional regulator [Desulfomonile tiedjei]|uniref:Transcriptional regulator containing PAS, AAA-type ATPase, and DNA-binding domains n=1 Tax=Desulfomonile tiedjei (strain ATCC 49306 / DSM 6799 / DCB-1) TaxID=706587 RepID=I4C5K2_DESTA|nr:sigma 54-interacting transcriptional regulator [Desulfomonile tiedjei]AFM24843.1 transcriptional regulator containing PAS, AAA-type ATPase, and DNA-binding domains [Desulfomonile tiedjei DSM 6799]
MKNLLRPETRRALPWEKVKQIWKDLHERPDLRKGLRPEIYDSWERSYHYNVQRGMRETTNLIPEREFAFAKENSKYLMETAVPVMERLSEFVRGTGFVVLLSDANCVSLKTIGDEASLEWSRRANVVERTVWREEKVGTNAGHLCMLLVKPISIYSYEHFCLFAILGAASFAPIVDKGRVIGSIGMVAPYERVSHHTLGMVVAAADHIQSILALNRVSKYHQVITDSMSDGVMVVDLDGTITYMNEKCSKILRVGSTDVIGANIHSIFGTKPENQFFVNTVTQGRTLIDDLLVLYHGKNQIRCHITCTPLHGTNPTDMGTVVIFRESERMNSIVGKWIGRSTKMTFDDIIGNNPKFQHCVNIAKTTCQSDSSILLLGESGTGKDVIAQAMHNESPRKNNPFLAINCAALPRELIASELFGYEEGAFTGAKKGGNVGKFELANQGTLFLDEIGDVPLDLQVALLRVLEEKSVIRMGGNKLVPVNVRIIAATNRNLEEEIARNRFRRDLYYRLGVIRLIIPPLRERADDIPLLVHHFLGLICKRFGKPLKKVSLQAMEALMNYEWPGNIRELQNVLESAIQLAPDDEIDYEFFKQNLGFETPLPVTAESNTSEDSSSEELRILRETLLRNRYNKSATAKELGVSRQCIYRRLQKYNLL